MDKENICPLCFSKNVIKTREISSLEASKFINRCQPIEFLQQLSSYIEDNIWHQTISYFMQCLNCSFEYSFPFKAADKKIYNLLYNKSGLNTDSWLWEFQTTYQIIKERINKIGINEFKILELGSGSGHFIKKISLDLISPSNCYITEYSDNCRNEITKLGIHSYSDILELDKANFSNAFDFICMFQVLEHMDNLNGIINDLNYFAKKNALIVISVPNFYQRIFYDKRKIFQDIPPIHISRFNLSSFKEISGIMNWDMNYYNIEPLSKKEKLLQFLYLNFLHSPFFCLFEKETSFILKTVRKLLLAIIYSLLFLVKIKPLCKVLFDNNMGRSQLVIYRTPPFL
jgi:SAM-dependent methyltransferase